MKHKDSVFVAACDVTRSGSTRPSAHLRETQGNKLDLYEDYRRDPRTQGRRRRVHRDAGSLAQPDDDRRPARPARTCTCEKPVSNEIEPAMQNDRCGPQSSRIVQVGLQQRSWHHFQEAATAVPGRLPRTSAITHCTMCRREAGGGGGGRGSSRNDAGSTRGLELGAVPGSGEAQAVHSRPPELARRGTTTAAATSRTGACTSPTS